MKIISILNIDDNVNDFNYLKDVLKNFSFTSANNISSALDLIKNNKYDLVIADSNLFSDFKFVEEIRSIKHNLPIVVLTSNDSCKNVTKATFAGIDAFISKNNKEDIEKNLEKWIMDLVIKNDKLDSFENYSQLLSIEPDALVVIDTKTLQIVDANEAALKLYGYTKEEFIHLDPFNVTAEPEKSKENLSGIAIGETKIIPLRWHKKKSGEIFPVEITATFRQYDGRILYLAVVKDVSKVIEANKLIQENEVFFQAIFEKSIDAIGITKNGYNYYVNDAYVNLFGYDTKEEVIGKLVVDLVIPEEKEKILNYIEARKNNLLAPQAYESIGVKKNGSHFIVDVHVSSYMMGTDIFTVAILRDITYQKKNLEALRESNTRFRKLFEEASQIPVQGFNREHKIVYWNNASAKAFGFTQEEALNQNFEDLIVPDSCKSEVYEAIENLFLNDKPVPSQELILKRKDGSDIHVYSTYVCISKENGEKELYCLDIDFSAKFQAEETLRKLSVAVEQSPTSIVITDIKGNIEYANPKFLQVSGYPIEEVLGKNPRFLKSGHTRSDEYAEMWKELSLGKEWRGEFHNKKKNGELYWESALIKPIKNEKDEITHYLAVKEDITENKNFNNQRLQSEEQLRNVWESSFDAMRLVDENGIITRVNDAYCTMFEKTREELEGKPFIVIYEEKYHEHSITSFKENFLTTSIKQKSEAELKLWNKKRIWVELSNSYIQREEQTPLLFSIFRDISDRKKQELELIAAKEKAEEMNKLKSSFLNNMSHEIRTPMVGILGFSQILFSEIESPELREFVEEIIKSGNRMMNTINSILDLSRIEANKLEVRIEEVNINEEVEEIVKPLKTLSEQNNLYFRIKHNADVTLNMDKHLFTQILNNLVGNAIKYTRTGGITIEIDKVQREDFEYCAFKVIDSGIGIPKEAISIIFDEFRQVSEGLNRQFEGTGLGLTITKKLVELLKGFIEVKSEVGVGSEFDVLFPIAKIVKSPPKPKEQVKIERDPDFIKRDDNIDCLPEVLLVENDSVNKTVMTLFLNKVCKIDHAVNGEESVNLAKNKQYAAILMDINLGTGMNGLEAAQEIRTLPGYENTPIVAVTAYAMIGDKERFLSAGCTHYISKPFDKETICKLVRELVTKNP